MNPSRSRQSDIKWTARSGILLNAATATYNLIPISRGALVTNVLINKLAVYGGTSTITIGYINNKTGTSSAAYFLNSAAVAPTVAGLKASNAPFYFEKGGMITLTLSKGNAAVTASSMIFAEFSQITV